MTAIYVLIDPRTEEIRYVGKTSRQLELRLRGHRRVFDWNPRIELVQEVPDDFWQEAERYWITYFRAIGCPLANVNSGGGGVAIGYRQSKEHSARISAALKGRSFPSMHQPHSLEWRQRQSDAMRRYFKDPAVRVAKSESLRLARARRKAQ